MSNIEKEPTSYSHLAEDRAETSETEEMPEIEKTEKGEMFNNYADFYASFTVFSQHQKIARIHGKRMENGELVDDPSGFVDAKPHKMTDRYANMNVYEGGKIIVYFRLDQNTIHEFRIEIIGK